MSRKIFFTPGPSALYFTVEEHLKQALKDQVMEINHRSNQATAYYQHASENLKALMNIPEDYHIFFLSSATEIWERQIHNLVIKKSFHFCNGTFSNRFYDFAKSWGYDAQKAEGKFGAIADMSNVEIPQDAELISFALNETSTGVTFPVEEIYKIRASHPDAIIAVDGVSAFPAIDIDFSKVDSAYFSVQKCFGLPAGLGVWIVNERCMAKAKAKEAAGHTIGSYQALPNLLKDGSKFQTTYTANVLNIFLLMKVSADMLAKGIDIIRRETGYKAVLLQKMVSDHPGLSHFVQDEKLRSKTIIVANTQVSSKQWIDELSNKGFVVGDGYGDYKGKQLRIASFPTHSKELIELLYDTIMAMAV
uniref:aminotransferase class V-fold PLP-dependent enzyme n=2 Tax=Roseivirga sp. TaxID=1964215 RepID=UPI004047753B